MPTLARLAARLLPFGCARSDGARLAILSRHEAGQRYRLQTSTQLASQQRWRIMFFGSDNFALASLKTLCETCRPVVQRLEIVTAYKGEENAVITYARQQNLTVHNWPPTIRHGDFDIGIVVSFGHLIPSKIIKLFSLGMINVHGSLLPRWRGAAPICYTLMNGDKHTGVTIMKIMPKKFDVGAIIAQNTIEVAPDETYLHLYEKLSKLGADLLGTVINKLPDVLNTAKPQNEEQVTHAPKITVESSFINWERMTATNVYNLQRALFGIESLRTNFGNSVIKLLNIKVALENTKLNFKENKIPGLAIYDKKNKKLCISCQGDSWITVETVIIPGRRPQSAQDFGTGFILNRKDKFCKFH